MSTLLGSSWARRVSSSFEEEISGKNALTRDNTILELGQKVKINLGFLMSFSSGRSLLGHTFTRWIHRIRISVSELELRQAGMLYLGGLIQLGENVA